MTQMSLDDLLTQEAAAAEIALREMPYDERQDVLSEIFERTAHGIDQTMNVDQLVQNLGGQNLSDKMDILKRVIEDMNETE